jgi:hypothetical protein
MILLGCRTGMILRHGLAVREKLIDNYLKSTAKVDKVGELHLDPLN